MNFKSGRLGYKGQHTIELSFILAIMIFLLWVTYYIHIQYQDETTRISHQLNNQDICHKLSNLAESVYAMGTGSKITTLLPPNREIYVTGGRLLEIKTDYGYNAGCYISTPELVNESGDKTFVITTRTVELLNIGEEVQIKNV
ncbi:hypothetical protein ACFLRC_04305 [Candidatus Altiarchaeota archaeon]